MRRIGASPALDAAIDTAIDTAIKHTVRCGGYEFDRVAYPQSVAAPMMSISRQQLAKMAAAGEIRVCRLGRKVLVPVDEIVRLLGGQP